MSDNGQRLMTIPDMVTRRGLFKDIDKIRDKIILLTHQLSLLEAELSEVKRRVKKFNPVKDNGRSEKRGRYWVGEKVTWSSRGIIHNGTILLVVEPKNYPDMQFRQSGIEKKYNVRTRGYYRYEESYIVEDDEGQQWWPRVGWLRRV